MDYGGFMEEREGDETLSGDYRCKAFFNNIPFRCFHLRTARLIRKRGNHSGDRLTNKRSDAAPAGIIHNNPNPRAFQVTAIVHRDVVPLTASKLTEKVNLALDVVNIVVLSVKINDFDGNDVSCSYLPPTINSAIAPLANNFELLVELGDWDGVPWWHLRRDDSRPISGYAIV